MKIFDPKTLGIALLLATATVAAADRLILSGASGQHLSGVVKSINEAGVVELQSPLSKTPLRLKAAALKRVVFGEKSSEAGQSEMLVVLANGDKLPINIQSFTRSKGLVGESPAVGELVLSPEKLSSLQFGVESRKVIFQGPGEPSGWQEPSSRKNLNEVRYEDGVWRVQGAVDAQRSVEYPTDFILRFQLEWSKGTQPNFKVSFADSGETRSQQADRYYLQFGSAGFEVKRESSGQQRYSSVLTSNRVPGSFAGRKVDVEVHVSRTNRTISLYLDGELEERGVDPVAVPPSGDSLMLTFSGQSKATQNLSGLSVRVLDNMRRRHGAEDRGNRDQDGLISRDDDRWSGTLNQIRNTKEGLELEFESALSPDPLALLMDDVSTVFFRQSGQQDEPSPVAFRLRLFGEGSLAVKSCRIADDKVLALHPLLGDITIPKSSVQQIERMVDEDNPTSSQ